MKINVKFYYNWTRIKDFMMWGLLGPTKLKIVHYRGNLEISDFQMS